MKMAFAIPNKKTEDTGAQMTLKGVIAVAARRDKLNKIIDNSISGKLSTNCQKFN